MMASPLVPHVDGSGDEKSRAPAVATTKKANWKDEEANEKSAVCILYTSVIGASLIHLSPGRLGSIIRVGWRDKRVPTRNSPIEEKGIAEAKVGGKRGRAQTKIGEWAARGRIYGYARKVYG